jgi:CubicO group peptidase (beta-lactamase class C family)
MRRILPFLALLFILGAPISNVAAQQPSIDSKLQGFDTYMAQVLKDWNVPGIGVGVVVKDKLVFAKGYGYRDYGKKLPYTPTTVQSIGSNTKLFTATAAGLLVDEGKLDWDKPIRTYVPSIKFYNDDLDRMITLRDMLSHRTGITRHDLIWYKSDFTIKELFDRLRYLEPSEPPRTTFLYNNMMYVGSGYVTALLSGQPWEQFVRDRILTPLGMSNTNFSVEDLEANPDHAVLYTERRESTELYQIPYYRDWKGVAPAGAINSNVVDLSKWLIAQMNGGKVEGKQVIPRKVIQATLAPSIAVPNTNLEIRGWGELLNSVYGMGRYTSSYRGHLLAYHGGDIDGMHSQVSMMPYDSIGVIVLVIGDHAAPLYNIVSYNLYERLLGLSLTPWSERQNALRLRNKEAGRVARSRAGGGRIAGTHPSHKLDDYVGEFENPAYGIVTIGKGDTALAFDFHKVRAPLNHFHYDRFDTPDDEQNGKWSVNFLTSPQGEVAKAEMSLDQAAVAFTRRTPAALTTVATLRQYVGTYETATGSKFEVVLRPDNTLAIQNASGTFQDLIPWQVNRFRIKEFPDVFFEFVVVNGRVTEMKQTTPGGEFRSVRKS